ncbi:MAG TPA: CHRD domain-containing protein [Gemmataceae bacterium]|jgi:hypothetical protein
MTRLAGPLLAVVAVAAAAAPARVQLISYFAPLDGPSEPTTSPGTGLALVDINPTAHTMHVHVTFSGLVTTGTGTTASHIHSATAAPFTGTAGVATTTPTFAGFPLGVTSGTYDNTLDMTLASSYNPSYVSGLNPPTLANAESTLFASIAAGTAYLNIHSNTFPGGEIRGFLRPVPEPASLALTGLAAAAALGAARRRRATRLPAGSA